jgi:hypothetical protein|tara:strand:- start:241 stop:906 length:666 start_codon:yes stop_codon:yes gene_type:complete
MTNKKVETGINAAFISAQKLIGGARKSATNPHFKSKYADLKECFNACSDILNDHDIHISQPTLCENGVYFVRTILTHESGETMQDWGVPILGWESQKNAMQAWGAGQTYARRYGICSMAGIAPEDDDGNSLGKHEKPTPKVVWPEGWGISKAKNQLREFYQEIHACTDVDQLEAYKASQTGFIKILQDCYPESLHGDGGDVNGLVADYKTLLTKLKEETNG